MYFLEVHKIFALFCRSQLYFNLYLQLCQYVHWRVIIISLKSLTAWEVMHRMISGETSYLIPLDPVPFPLTLKQTENQSFHQSYKNLHWLFLRQNQYTKIWHNEVSNHLLLQYACVKMRCLPTFMSLFSLHHFC